MTEAVLDISTATTDQAMRIKEVNEAMGDIDRGTQENAAMAEQTAAAALALAEQAHALRAAVSAFIVEGEHTDEFDAAESLADDVWDDSDDADDIDPPPSRHASNQDRPIQPTLGFTLDPARA